MDPEKVKKEMQMIDAEKDEDDAIFYVRAIERLVMCERRLKMFNDEVLRMRVKQIDARLEYLKTAQEMMKMCKQIQKNSVKLNSNN